MSVVRWAVVTEGEAVSDDLKARSELLSSAIKNAGFENELAFETFQGSDLQNEIGRLQKTGFHALRVRGDLRKKLVDSMMSVPTNILALSSADTVIFDSSGQTWCKNSFYDGVLRLIAHDLEAIDLSGAAFVMGAGLEARAVVAALSRAGFNKIAISDREDERAENLVRELRRAFFNVQFQFTPRIQIRHLPGTSSIAVNTLIMSEDEQKLSELFYFNFLKAGAFWVEVPFTAENSSLVQESQNAGAKATTCVDLAAHIDAAFAESCFSVRIDVASHRAELEKRLGLSVKTPA